MSKGTLTLDQNGGATVTLDTDLGVIEPGELALITIDALRLDPRALYSKDGWLDGEREGALIVKCNGQPTSVSWSTKKKTLKNPDKFRDVVVFFGSPRGGVDVSFRAIESDAEVVACLRKIGQGLRQIGGLAGNVPGYGTAASAALQLGASILDYVAEEVDDDVELGYLGGLAPTAGNTDPTTTRAGKYRIARRLESSEEGEPDIAMDMRVRRFRPANSVDVVVLLDAVKLRLPARLKSGELLLEITLGSGGHAQTFSFREPLRNGDVRLPKIFSLNGKRLYRGPSGHGIPVSINAAVVFDRNELEALEGIIENTSSLVGAIAGDQVEHLSEVTKAVQSARSLMLEFLPKKVSIGHWSGLLNVGEWAEDLGPLPPCIRTVELPETGRASIERILIRSDGKEEDDKNENVPSAVFDLSIGRV